jgi:hypothetical protein
MLDAYTDCAYIISPDKNTQGGILDYAFDLPILESQVPNVTMPKQPVACILVCKLDFNSINYEQRYFKAGSSEIFGG